MTKQQVWDIAMKYRKGFEDSWTYARMSDKEKNGWQYTFDEITNREDYSRLSENTIAVILNSAYSAYLYGIGYYDGIVDGKFWRN